MFDEYIYHRITIRPLPYHLLEPSAGERSVRDLYFAARPFQTAFIATARGFYSTDLTQVGPSYRPCLSAAERNTCGGPEKRRKRSDKL